jgi:hypothetical protein
MQFKLGQAYITHVSRLASLAPDVAEAVLNGHEPNGPSLKSLTEDIPLSWDEQRVVFKGHL